MPLPDEVLSQPRLELGTDFEDPVLSRRNSQLIRSHTAQLIDDLNSRLEPDPILVVLDVFADRVARTSRTCASQSGARFPSTA